MTTESVVFVYSYLYTHRQRSKWAKLTRVRRVVTAYRRILLVKQTHILFEHTLTHTCRQRHNIIIIVRPQPRPVYICNCIQRTLHSIRQSELLQYKSLTVVRNRRHFTVGATSAGNAELTTIINTTCRRLWALWRTSSVRPYSRLPDRRRRSGGSRWAMRAAASKCRYDLVGEKESIVDRS